MKNVLNKNHPSYPVILDSFKHSLNCLHFAMQCLKDHYTMVEGLDLSEEQIQDYRETCTELENSMQVYWGFPKDKDMHTHIKHFGG